MLKRNQLSLALSTIMALTPLSISINVLAQEDSPELALEEILVTARKKQELVVEVPMNIATVGEVEISKRNLIEKEELFRSLAGAASPRGQLILRGLSGSNSSVPKTTSTFTDGVPFNFKNLFDVERVEILRGPQGTLWGSNAIGGTVQIITKKPNLQEFEIHTSVQAKHERNRPGVGRRVSAALNIPLIEDKLALRITGSDASEKGKVLNTFTGRTGKDEDHFVRTQLMWVPDEQTRINFMYVLVGEFDDDSSSVDVNAPSTYSEATLTENPAAPYGYDVTINRRDCPGGTTNRTTCRDGQLNGHDPRFTRWGLMDAFDKDNVDLFVVNAERDNIFPGADLTYSGSFRRVKDFGRQAWWSRADALDMFRTWIIDQSEDERTTHELRLQSNTENNFEWTAGAFYDYYETLPSDSIQWQYHAGDNRSRAIAAALWNDTWGLGDPSQIGQDLYNDDTKNFNTRYHKYVEEELALFGESSYTFDLGSGGKLELTAGLRYYELKDDKRLTQTGIWIGSGPVEPEISIDGEYGNRKKFSVNYMPNENLGIFALYSEGYRPGGNNGPTPPNDCANDENIGSYVDRYSSDEIKNYEIGIKGLTFNNRMSFSTAIYHIDWSGVQAPVYMPSCGFSYTANAATARSRGFEFESTTLLADRLKFIFNASYTNSEMTSDVVPLGAEDGDDMTMVPKYNFYMALDHEFAFLDRDASVRLEFLGYDEYKSHFNVKDSDVSPSYELLNLSGSYAINNKTELSVYINNLLNDEIILFKRSRTRSDSPDNELMVEYGDERSISMRLDYTF